MLLLMRDSRDRELLAETLDGSYEVTATADPEALDAAFDCCVFDGDRFGAVESRLAERTREEPAAFQPLVLLVSERDVASLPAERWAVADDVISLPTEREAILTRIGNLVERRRVSAALAREREALARQNERLETFASVVSHDLRNPLSVAEGHVELGLETGDPTHLEAIDRALGRMRELIEDLLALAREGTDESAFERIQLAPFLEGCWGAVDTPEASLRVDAEVSVAGHRSRLRNLFENLFRNAVEHGRPDVTVEVGPLDGGFFVEDDGPGIPEADRGEVLESGYSTGSGGTGLGLAIVEQIARAHGWSVAVAEGTAGGARFEFTGVDVEPA